MLTALFAALLLSALTMPPALAATRPAGPTPGSDLSQQISALQQKLQQQQATINSIADQEEGEQASVRALNSKVAADQQRQQALNRQLDRVARIEYERPAVTLTTVMNARNLGQLLSGMAQARVISNQQRQLLDAAAALKAGDQRKQSAAQAQLDKISKQKAQATAIGAKIQAEISTLQAEQRAAEERAAAQKAAQEKAAQEKAAQQQAAPQPAAPPPAPASSQPAASPAASTPSISAATSITLSPGPSNPNRFDPGQCTWYVATIYSIPWLGNANQWPAAAAADGQAEGQTPVAGAIMESADSAFGHVSVVTSVSDNNDWTVTEMNFAGGPGVTDTRHVTRATSNLVTFIY